MKMKTERRRKLSTNNKEHFEEKQDTLLRSRTSPHYKNRRIRSHHRNNIIIKRKTNNIHVKNHKLNRIEL